MASPSNPHNVAVGQVWYDNDPRSEKYHGHKRYCQIIEVGATHAQCQWFHYERNAAGKNVRVPGRRTRSRLDRFKPTTSGYKRVS